MEANIYAKMVAQSQDENESSLLQFPHEKPLVAFEALCILTMQARNCLQRH